ncbi:MAG TPA: ABC transporter ATP-binding protein [Vicinamibacterales bacterium]|nr:ABC transporter ATP-binding protein [Vicinamibacterales bacterium]
MSAAAIETRSLGKRYGRIKALEDLSLRVEPGEVFGFLGPNGAGKTTTVRLLLGLLAPTAGTASVLGHEVRVADAAWRREIGYLPGELALWPSFTGERTLAFLEQLTGRRATWRNELLERLQLRPGDLARRVGTYSDGMKQKLGIVQALQCAPRLALLDEPTKGLDPLIQLAFYELLIDLNRRGITIFFSSHVLPEVERVCHRVAMLRAGTLVTISDVDQLRRSMPRRVVVLFRDDVDAADLSTYGEVVASTARRIELLVAADRVPSLVSRLATLPLLDLLIEPPRLEDAFLERYR